MAEIFNFLSFGNNEEEEEERRSYRRVIEVSNLWFGFFLNNIYLQNNICKQNKYYGL